MALDVFVPSYSLFSYRLSHFTRDRHCIAKKRDKFLAVFMIVLAVVANAVAVYSDACS